MLYPDQTETGELAYNTFGFKLEKKQFVELLLKHSNRQQLELVAWRFYLIDNLQFRIGFSEPSFFFPPDFSSGSELTGQLSEETKALRLYLLCTCIDALSPEKEFISYQDWFKTKDKTKYGIDDQSIKEILEKNSNQLATVDGFRNTVAEVYNTVYSPVHGNRLNFYKVFHTLPAVMKRLLIGTYFISGFYNTDPLSPDITDKGLTYSVWDAAYSNWCLLDTDKKIKRIAEYFYGQRRNFYTHQASSKRILEKSHWKRDSTIDPFLQYVSTADIVIEKKQYQIIAFRSEEDEPAILRLMVSVAWLTKLGYTVDEEKMENLRWYHNRRTRAYSALEEIASIQSVLEYYSNASGVQNSLYLPIFSVAAVSTVRSYLYVTTPNEAAIDEYLNNYVSHLNKLNELIDLYNKTFVAPYKGHKNAADLEGIRVAQSEVIKQIAENENMKVLKTKTRQAYYRLNHLADRMWWPD